MSGTNPPAPRPTARRFALVTALVCALVCAWPAGGAAQGDQGADGASQGELGADEAAPERSPTTATEALQAADAHLASGDGAGAERLYLLAVTLEPLNWPVYYVVADFYALERRECARAVPFYDAYLEHVAEPVLAHMEVLEHALGCHAELGNHPRAIEIADQAHGLLRARGLHGRARAMLRQRADLELKSDRADLALETLQRVLFDDYKDVEAHILRARAHFQLRRYDQALEGYERVQRAFGELRFLDLEMGITLLMLKRPGEAVVALRRSLVRDGEVPETWRWLAHAHQLLGHRLEAEQSYRRCLDLAREGSPLEATASNNLAWLLVMRARPGDPALLEALALARVAATIDPGEATYCDTLAEIYLRLGRTGPALTWSQRAAILSPGDPYFLRQVERARRYASGFEAAGGRVTVERWRPQDEP